MNMIRSWYEAQAPQWAEEILPPQLLEVGPRGLLVWQWIAIPLLIAAAWILGAVLSRLTRTTLMRFTGRTKATGDDTLVGRLRGPLTAAWTFGALLVFIPAIGFHQAAEKWMVGILREGLIAVVFWTVARCIDVGARMLVGTPWAAARPASRSLVPLAGRVAKIIVLAMAVVTFVSELGYPVASLVAGLGIGGLAFALAAQKTVENLFGAFSIGADQPFREGDLVIVEGTTGTVENIGLRSTRIRTLDRSVVTMPNGKLADMRLESLSARDRMRLACTIGLVYGTTESQMRRVLEGFERALRDHPKIWPDKVIVLFKEFGASSLDIEIAAWFQTAEWGEFQVIRQEILLSFMAIVDAAGTSFAFPTRTVHIVPSSPSPSVPSPPVE